MKSVKSLLLMAPDSQLDKSMKDIIETWGDEPTSLDILEILDESIHCGLASSFTIRTLQILLEEALKAEGKEYDDILPDAVWRNR